MKIQGMSGRFWVVLKPSSVVELSDILFPCTFGGLMNRVRNGLHPDEIAGMFAYETEATEAAMRLLGKCPVRPLDSAFFEVLVNVMVQPKVEGLTARELGEVAVEAVTNAVHQGEETGFRHRLGDRVALGAGTVELRNQIVVYG
jgi:hypothetical protein